MSNPYVTKVTLKKKQIVLTVKLEGFTAGDPIELSGYATQNGGAFAVFNDIQKVPEPNPDDTTIMYVTAAPSRDFEEGDAITVVLRAAMVWATVLEEGEEEEPSTGHGPSISRPHLAEEGTSWGRIRSVTYPAPSMGNDGHASTGSEASFHHGE
jgi:hypothetical protein